MSPFARRTGTLVLLLACAASVAGAGDIAEIENLHNYPNPFDPEQETTTITFDVTGGADDRWAEITVFDIRNRPVWNRVLDALPAGHGSVEWGGQNDRAERVGNGVFFCRVTVHAGNSAVAYLKIGVK